MKPSKEIQVICESSSRGFKLLSVYNLHINSFLSFFPNEVIQQLRMFWIDAEKDFVTSLVHPIPTVELDFQFDGLDVQILTVEIELSNGFLIDSNLVDEIFCRVPPHYPVDELVRALKGVGATSSIQSSTSESIANLSSNQWVTQPLDE